MARWEALLRGDTDLARERYAAARDLAQARGYEFLPAKKVAERPLAAIMERFEASLNAHGNIDDRKGRAFLGAVKEPGTANKEIKLFGTVLRRVNKMRMLGLDIPLGIAVSLTHDGRVPMRKGLQSPRIARRVRLAGFSPKTPPRNAPARTCDGICIPHTREQLSTPRPAFLSQPVTPSKIRQTFTEDMEDW
ncbi:hypothetical protein C6W92_13350 [Roseovarius sp. A46]|uniref:hypothetical protein n=1 Tax=Roseovarius sp. A46 TaxID=2109331 RepID=UPI001011E769|nr:hypothetical protein [Roseovarius sp. A46]RXV60756.1 hypothetical protein C6W92_13350 [Roseovarius sp. A46]